MTVNTIRFTSLKCDKAEAIFGDMIEVLYNGRSIWSGAVNSFDTVNLPDRRHFIPEGIGGNINIDQWYFGQGRQTVHRKRVLQSDSDEDRDEFLIVGERDDGDPGGIYRLYYRVSRELWTP